jgi:hypothetical protein
MCTEIRSTRLPLQVDCSFTASVSGGIVPGTGSPPTFPDPSAASRFFLNRLERGASGCVTARAGAPLRLSAGPLAVGVALAEAPAAAVDGFASACLALLCFPSVSWALAEWGAGSAAAGLMYTGPCAAASPAAPAAPVSTGTIPSALAAVPVSDLGQRETDGLAEVGSVAFLAFISAGAGCEASDRAVFGAGSTGSPAAAEADAERADAGTDSRTSPLRALG